MIPYTKPICKISPVLVGESAAYVGREEVWLMVDFGNDKSEIIRLLLPKGESIGDSLTVSHQLFMNMGDDADASSMYDHVLRTVGFRPEAETMQ